MSGERRIGAAVLCAGLVAVLGAGCGGSAAGGDSAATASAPKDMGPAPGYQARRLGSSAVFHVQDGKGRALLLTSFAPWCGECRAELPQMQRLYERHRADGLTIIGVSVDDGGDDASAAFARGLGVTFDLVHDEDHNYQAAFRTLGVPSSALVDRTGRLVTVWQGGFDVASRDTEDLVQRALQNGSGASPAATVAR
jgi:peroxiredoxin